VSLLRDATPMNLYNHFELHQKKNISIVSIVRKNILYFIDWRALAALSYLFNLSSSAQINLAQIRVNTGSTSEDLVSLRAHDGATWRKHSGVSLSKRIVDYQLKA